MEDKVGVSLIMKTVLKRGHSDKKGKLEMRFDNANERMSQILELQQKLGITSKTVLNRFMKLNQRIGETQVCSMEDLEWLEQELISSSQKLTDYIKRRNIEQSNEFQQVGTLEAYSMAEETLGRPEGESLKDRVDNIMRNDAWLQAYGLLHRRIEAMFAFLEVNTLLGDELQALSGRWKELRTMLNTRVLSDCESLFQILIEEMNHVYRPGENLLALLDRQEL
ncbi:hypothetical protein [Bacteroides reticulotermitis]|uniref:Uncharacterized protein n=2 Tax=Bacteroides reticulotermitis TaxID=1133319 RepID=W4UN98_9BACE|nr:hypothetical protein [Bacteroides reticulotermitis]MBB4043290.1 hypothetical protein [Bacteroides reticulotermitis]GAE81989.1 hypothetical protein JCM10512_158 [Bacteroides reticulotermitis JCM 10512]